MTARPAIKTVHAPARPAPRRGRPTAARAAALEPLILDAARALFLSRGYANTSMDAVAARAAVSKGTVYARYPNKGELFRAVAEERLAAWAAVSTSSYPAENGLDIADSLLKRALGTLDIIRLPEVQAFDHMVLSEAKRFPELTRLFLELQHRSFTNVMAEEITLAGRGDGSPVADAYGVALVIATSLISWFRMESILGEVSREAGEQFAHRLVSLCLGGRHSW
ncbi:TetR/AcrR family transcriptional regulator [Sphingomonas ginsenosidivorax]|nr:TetR/AcrR family transcriptional regulator [Sphingomonas ginsenosidivorax]